MGFNMPSCPIISYFAESDEEQIVLLLPGHDSDDVAALFGGFVNNSSEKVIKPKNNENCDEVIKTNNNENFNLENDQTSYYSPHNCLNAENNGFLCDACGKNFKLKRQLKNHRFKMHSPVKSQYNCNVCEASFFLKSALRSHSKTHEDPKFKCPKCSKLYKTNFSLKRHFKICSVF